MPHVFYNPNPGKDFTIDCVVRAISKLFDFDWDTAYLRLAVQGFEDKSMPTADKVWGHYLHRNGYRRHIIPDTCPDCYTVKDFCEEHKEGFYLIATGSHVITVVDGDYCDTWDSGDETITYYFEDNEATKA